MKSFIKLDEAISILDENTRSLEKERVSLIDSIGKIAVDDIFSRIDNPPFNKSAMDGYALKVEDLMKFDKFKIIDEIFAGNVSKSIVESGTCMKIMTGAPIPIGADAVVKKEDVTVKDGFIVVNTKLKNNENVCFKGEDIQVGTTLINRGKKLDYADIGILASAGIDCVEVNRKPKVGFISTGDEVIDVGMELKEGKIFNSNKYSILGRLKELGVDVTYINHETDNFIEIGNKIKEAYLVSDIIVTTGGASVGDKDLIKEALDYIGGEKLFWKVLIKPGSAVLCSKLQNKLIISLSGNPTAALTTFELLVRPVLEKLSGSKRVNINREKAILRNDFLKSTKQQRFLRGCFSVDESGKYVEITQVKSGNGILSSALNSNCLVEIESGNDGVRTGDIVNIIKF
ncbi:gephyrin-like molybdotransferase Glp [Clostridioides difficile]